MKQYITPLKYRLVAQQYKKDSEDKFAMCDIHKADSDFAESFEEKL